MKKFLCYTLLFSLLTHPAAAADDKAVLTRIYEFVGEEYIHPVEIGKLAVPALKALNKIDSRIRIADDDTRMSVYAGGRLIKTLRKPQDQQNVAAWVNFTLNIIRAAQKVSPELQRKDFEIIDTIMAHSIKAFDADSAYYPDLELTHSAVAGFKPKRAYYSRDLDDGLLYIRLGALNKHTGKTLAETVVKRADLKGLILDLRGNPGGELKQAVNIAGMFLDGGIIVSVQGRTPDSAKIYNAPAGDILQNKPIVVLIDGKTASSAEVLAGALQEQSRAVVVGAKSYGKGSVQKLIGLPNDSRLALTNAAIFLPSGKKIAGEGILPDICTAGELENRNAEKILQRNKGLGFCERQERGKSELDIDVARAYLLQNVKN